MTTRPPAAEDVYVDRNVRTPVPIPPEIRTAVAGLVTAAERGN